MNVDKLTQSISSGQVDPVYLVTGTETALNQRALAALRAIVPADQQTMNYSRYDLRETDLDTIMNEVDELPFFGDYREIVLDNPDFLTGSGSVTKQESAINDLVDYLQQPATTTVLVFMAPYPKLDARKRVVKALKKAATLVETKPLSEADARRTIRADLAQQQVSITDGGLDALIARTQSNYSAMVAALPKLSMYAHNTGSVDADAVEQLVPRQLTDSVFDMVSAVMQRNVASALRQYRELLQQQEEPLRLISLLESQFRLLIQVQIFSSRGYTQGAAADALKVHPYRVKLAWRSVRQLDHDDLTTAYDMLVRTETAMKRGTVDKELGFELFVLQFAGNGKRYARQ